MSDIKKLLKNFSSSAVGNIFGQAINFFTLMYLPRVLGPDGYGIFNFAQSYAMYFLLLSDLGLSLYCVKIINQVEIEKRESIINKIYSIKFLLSIFSTIIFIISCIVMPCSILEKNTLYAIALSILFSGITIDYLFNALNNMKYIGISVAIKNIVFFIICVTFVKNINQTYYVSIAYSIGIFMAVLFLILIFNKTYFKLRINMINLKDFKIIRNSLPLAISLFMVQINNNFDIIYLSFTKTQDEVGYYSAPYKIINFLIAVLCIYFNAAYPTIAKLINKSKEELNDYISKFYSIGVTFVLPMVTGGIILNKGIISLLFGDGFVKSEIIFAALLPLIFIRMVTSTYGAVLIMGEGSKFFSQGVCMGAIINIVLNVILVPKYGSLGAAIATLICECLQGIYLYICFRRYCESNLLKKSIIPTLSSIGMLIVLCLFDKINLFLEIILGALVYGLILLIIYIIVYPSIRIKILKIINKH